MFEGVSKERLERAVDKFLSKIEVNDIGCWIWTGTKDRCGYGKQWFINTTFLVHRFSYLVNVGEIPAGLYVCHHCDRPSCVNPSHLFLGTQSDNIRDSYRKGRSDKRNEKHGRAKLTEEQVREIRCKWFLDEKPSRKIALEYGVHYPTIDKIVKGKSWKTYLKP